MAKCSSPETYPLLGGALWPPIMGSTCLSFCLGKAPSVSGSTIAFPAVYRCFAEACDVKVQPPLCRVPLCHQARLRGDMALPKPPGKLQPGDSPEMQLLLYSGFWRCSFNGLAGRRKMRGMPGSTSRHTRWIEWSGWPRTAERPGFHVDALSMRLTGPQFDCWVQQSGCFGG